MGVIGDDGREYGNHYNYMGYIGIMEKKTETTIVRRLWGRVGWFQ